MLKISNEPLIKHVFEYNAVIVPISINNSMNKGFAKEIKINFPSVMDSVNATNYGDRRKYGTVVYSKSDGITFCLCHMYRPQYRKKDSMDFVCYDALEKCLNDVKSKMNGKKIGLTLIGSTIYDGNGDKERIRGIIDSILADTDSTIHIYDQKDVDSEMFKKIAELHKLVKDGEISRQEYKEKRENIEWERKHGIYKKKTNDFVYLNRYC